VLYKCRFLGAFGKSLKANISAVMPIYLSVRPSACNNSSPIGLIFTKFDVSFFFFENLAKKFKFV